MSSDESDDLPLPLPVGSLHTPYPHIFDEISDPNKEAVQVSERSCGQEQKWTSNERKRKKSFQTASPHHVRHNLLNMISPAVAISNCERSKFSCDADLDVPLLENMGTHPSCVTTEKGHCETKNYDSMKDSKLVNSIFSPLPKDTQLTQGKESHGSKEAVSPSLKLKNYENSSFINAANSLKQEVQTPMDRRYTQPCQKEQPFEPKNSPSKVAVRRSDIVHACFGEKNPKSKLTKIIFSDDIDCDVTPVKEHVSFYERTKPLPDNVVLTNKQSPLKSLKSTLANPQKSPCSIGALFLDDDSAKIRPPPKKKSPTIKTEEIPVKIALLDNDSLWTNVKD